MGATFVQLPTLCEGSRASLKGISAPGGSPYNPARGNRVLGGSKWMSVGEFWGRWGWWVGKGLLRMCKGCNGGTVHLKREGWVGVIFAVAGPDNPVRGTTVF